ASGHACGRALHPGSCAASACSAASPSPLSASSPSCPRWPRRWRPREAFCAQRGFGDELNQTRTRTVTWEDPLAALPAAAGMSGLELIRAVFGGTLPPPPIMSTIGISAGEAEEGRVIFRGEAAEYLYIPIGVIHAGFAMTILDSAMGCAVHTTLAQGERYTTLETKVNFVRAITTETGPVRCEGVVVHRGGRVATAEGKLFAENSGKLLAHGSST